MHASSGDTCRAVALQHHGIVLLASFLVANGLRSGALVQLPPEWLSTALGVYAVYPTRRHLSPKVRARVDFLVAAARDKGWPA